MSHSDTNASGRWTADDEEYLRVNYAGTSLAELAARLKRTITAIRSRAKVLNVKRGSRRAWNVAEDRYLREQYADSDTRLIAGNLGRTLAMTYNRAHVLDLSKSSEFLARNCRLQKGSGVGEAYRFRKGDVPKNKGHRRPGWHSGRMQETQFKKGTLSGRAKQLHRPIGTILADHEGYLRIKMREHDAQTRGWHKEVWPLLHHQTWIKAHGPIPGGHLIVFRDKDRSNCALENLECISMAENARRNVMWNNYPRELAEAIQLNGALKRRLKKLHATQ